MDASAGPAAMQDATVVDMRPRSAMRSGLPARAGRVSLSEPDNRPPTRARGSVALGDSAGDDGALEDEFPLAPPAGARRMSHCIVQEFDDKTAQPTPETEREPRPSAARKSLFSLKSRKSEAPVPEIITSLGHQFRLLARCKHPSDPKIPLFVSDCIMTPDGRYMITSHSATTDQPVRVIIWDNISRHKNGDEHIRYILDKRRGGHSTNVVSMQVSGNSDILVTGAVDGSIYLWHIETGTRLLVIAEENEGHETPVMGIGISSRATQILSCEYDGRIHLSFPTYSDKLRPQRLRELSRIADQIREDALPVNQRAPKDHYLSKEHQRFMTAEERFKDFVATQMFDSTAKEHIQLSKDGTARRADEVVEETPNSAAAMLSDAVEAFRTLKKLQTKRWAPSNTVRAIYDNPDHKSQDRRTAAVIGENSLYVFEIFLDAYNLPEINIQRIVNAEIGGFFHVAISRRVSQCFLSHNQDFIVTATTTGDLRLWNLESATSWWLQASRDSAADGILFAGFSSDDTKFLTASWDDRLTLWDVLEARAICSKSLEDEDLLLEMSKVHAAAKLCGGRVKKGALDLRNNWQDIGDAARGSDSTTHTSVQAEFLGVDAEETVKQSAVSPWAAFRSAAESSGKSADCSITSALAAATNLGLAAVTHKPVEMLDTRRPIDVNRLFDQFQTLLWILG